MKLHLCCGLDYRQGFVNVDMLENGVQDVTANLNERWTFAEDGSVDHILINSGLEHMASVEHFLLEAERVLKPGGTLELLVPHFRAPSAYRLTHRHYFSWSYFDVFPEAHDVVKRLRVKKNELIVESKFPWSGINLAANVLPKFWERLCYVSGVHVILEKVES